MALDNVLHPANVQSLALSVRPDGQAWAVWGDTRAGATNQDIWGSKYDPTAGTWSAPLRLDDAPGTTNQLSPTVAFTSSDTALSWRDNRLNANGDTQARNVPFPFAGSEHFALTYDGLNRLTAVTGPVPETFALDGPSNVLTRSGTTEQYDKANRLIDDGAVHNVWSNADRLTSRGTDTFIYDPLDRLTNSTVAGTARVYTYNGDGLLQTRTGGVAASFLWDPSTTPSQELKQGNDNIIYGLGPLYVVKADLTTLTFARDGSKSVRAEINSSGAVTASFRYRVYGQMAQSTAGSPAYLGYAGQLLDPSGLYYMRARWYDPVTGRFVSRDPLAGSLAVPVTLNAYAYAAGNPVMRTDPSGQFAFVLLLIPFIAPEAVVVWTAVVVVAVGGVQWVWHATENGGQKATDPVVRGGTNTPERWRKGADSIDEEGRIQGASVNSGDATIEELAGKLKGDYGKIGVSTVGEVERAGGRIVPDPTASNPYHCRLCDLTPEQAAELFPTRRNPSPR